VLGGWLLHQLTEGMPLDFFLGFSSVAATWGSQHLASYAAANAFLDGLARHRHTRDQPALSVSWGPWELESNLFGAEVLEFLTSTGLRTLSAPQCLRLLGGLLASGVPEAVVCAADWSVYKPVLEARIERPLLRTVTVVEEPAEEGSSPLPALLRSARGREGRRALLLPYLRELIAGELGLPPEQVSVQSDAMANGLDSLMVMSVVRHCKRDLRVSVRPNQFFELATLEDWADLLAAQVGSGDGDATRAADGTGDAPPPAVDWSDASRITSDVVLDPAIVPSGRPRRSRAEPEEVLLTGATGFVGAHLLERLLARTSATVHCLVRCTGPEDGLARIRRNVERYLPWPDGAERRIRVVPGDLAQPLLGLTESRFADLGGRLDAIYHNGALVNFSYTYEQSRPANVGGTAEILRLACTGSLTPVTHVSTYGIWGLPEPGRTLVAEDAPISGAGRLVTGYVQSKWAAERLVELARERGVPVDVHRLGRVLGDSRTGACLTTHFTTRMIKGCLQLGLAPDLDLEIEMTPVDYVAGAVLAISLGEHRPGGVYHLVNRNRLAFRDLVRVLRERGWALRTVPVDAWWAALQEGLGSAAEEGGDNALHQVLDVVEEFVVGGEEAIDYDDAAVERALEGTGISCPPLDERLLHTYLDWLVGSGYLPGPEA